MMPQQEISVHGNTYRLWRTEEQINSKIYQLAQWINKKFELAEQPPILMEVQTGGKYLLVDLHRKLGIDVHIDAVGITSYPEVEKQVPPKITSMWRSKVKGRDVILVEDIVDSGKTTQYLKKMLISAGAKTVTIIAIVARKHTSKPMGEYDRVGFIYKGDEWLHGYGLDDGQSGREQTNIYYKTN